MLADTHLTAGRLDRLPAQVWEALGDATEVFHAGDVVEAELLERLGAVAPVHAVLGNNDHTLAGLLPERLEVELGGHHVALVHDAGPRAGRERRLHRWFPHAEVIVFGHSHLPLDEVSPLGQRLFNPGSPTQRRRAPFASYGWITIGPGGVTTAIRAL